MRSQAAWIMSGSSECKQLNTAGTIREAVLGLNLRHRFNNILVTARLLDDGSCISGNKRSSIGSSRAGLRNDSLSKSRSACPGSGTKIKIVKIDRMSSWADPWNRIWEISPTLVSYSVDHKVIPILLYLILFFIYNNTLNKVT